MKRSSIRDAEPTRFRKTPEVGQYSSAQVGQYSWTQPHPSGGALNVRSWLMSGTTAQPSRLRDIPPGIWALGFVSLLMDISSEMIHALLPVYLVTVLGTSMVTVGIIEGIAEATASIVKVFSGRALRLARQAQAAGGHWLRPRRIHQADFPARIIGGLAGCGALHRSHRQGYPGRASRRAGGRYCACSICAARVSGCASRSTRSARFSARRSAIGLMWLTANNFQAVFWIAVIPAFLSLALDPLSPCMNRRGRKGCARCARP